MGHAAMNTDAVGRRLSIAVRKDRSPLQRDIAWAMVFAPQLLTSNKIQPLTTERLAHLKDVFVEFGGLEAPYLPVRGNDQKHRSIRDPSFDSEDYEDDDCGDDDYVVPAVPVSKRRKSAHPEGVTFIPNPRLKEKYRRLEVSDEAKEIVKETEDIGGDVIPVGTFREDSQPARLVTATINVATTALEYQIQPLDKNFVKTPDSVSYEIPTGTTWSTTADIDKDGQKVMSTRALQGRSHYEVSKYVFDELRSDGQFDNFWLSYQDMIAHPGLMDTVCVLKDPTIFTFSPHDPDASTSLRVRLQSDTILHQLGPHQRGRETGAFKCSNISSQRRGRYRVG